MQTAIDECYGGTLLPPAGVIPRAPETPKSSDTHREPAFPATASCVTDTESYLFQCTPVARSSAVIVDADDDYDVLAITRNQGKVARERKEESSGKLVDEEGKTKGPSKEEEDSRRRRLDNEEIKNPSRAVKDNAATHSFNSKKTPAYTYESKAANPHAVKQTLT